MVPPPLLIVTERVLGTASVLELPFFSVPPLSKFNCLVVDPGVPTEMAFVVSVPPLRL